MSVSLSRYLRVNERVPPEEGHQGLQGGKADLTDQERVNEQRYCWTNGQDGITSYCTVLSLRLYEGNTMKYQTELSAICS